LLIVVWPIKLACDYNAMDFNNLHHNKCAIFVIEHGIETSERRRNGSGWSQLECLRTT